MNVIGTTGQAFLDTLFLQLHNFRFINLLQPRSLTVVDGRVINLGLIIYFVTTQLFLKDELGRIHAEIFNLFSTKLSQYLIILELPWFRKYLPYAQFDKNTVTFDSPHYLQYCSPSHQSVTISGLNIPFDHSPCLPSLFYQTENLSNTDDFASDPHFCLL